ncbi:MAG TPA: hypothetical protein VHB20_18680 [Verrucomicrobiae bacterium]|jgi:anti-sigma factor RsiW|nr:hypothetical protein [Verrucomicrobiae bacterium]
MNQELELKLQAWVDGELSEAEARRMQNLIATDPAADALAAELRDVKALLSGAEMARTVPEGREFYWSKIERQIQAERSVASAPAPNWLAGWRRLLMPLAGLAAAACVVLVTVKQSVPSPNFDVVASTDASMETMMYHDQSAGLTVVWLQDKNAGNGAEAVTADDNSPMTD